MYLPLNVANAIVIRRDLELHFQGHKISENRIIFNTWNILRASEKYSSMTLIEVDIYH